MPNWCNNKLTVFGPDEDVQRFKKNAIGNSPWHTEQEKKNVLNFHSLTPVPPEVVSAGYDQAGYEWELMNWGCKWGACSTELVEEREGHLTYFFDTAWSPPIPFLSKLAHNGLRSPSSSITRKWAWVSRVSPKFTVTPLRIIASTSAIHSPAS